MPPTKEMIVLSYNDRPFARFFRVSRVVAGLFLHQFALVILTTFAVHAQTVDCLARGTRSSSPLLGTFRAIFAFRSAKQW
jgi:hypothetical protein